ncbi:S8 family peptidase [Metabacillus sp. RGM 3146]|uniref:S8 family peptidase n=1 Tax=Metabacillus sp. RGM 3146 TaxID=3401092 RepID=UPI003B9C1811
MSIVKLTPFRVGATKESISGIPQGIRMIGAPSYWQQGFKGEGTVVAVLDTGCQTSHPDLRGQIIGGRNFTNDYLGIPSNFQDNHGHGTHVCGTIAGTGDNGGAAGAAPKAKLLVLKVLSGSGEGKTENITAAVKYATRWRGPKGEKVRVISMSLGGPDTNPSLHAAIKSAVQNNIIVVCAAGNDGDGNARTSEYSYPGAYPEVVEVGSVSFQQRISPFSDSNSEIDLVAPGEKILSTYPPSKYAVLSGTSMATPHVSGALALIISKYEKKLKRTLSEPEIYRLLIQNTVSLGYPRTDEGNGMLKLKGGNGGFSI